MIALRQIADILYNIYYSGRPTSEDRLDVQDFEQWVTLANTSIKRRFYYALQREQDLLNYISNNIETKEFTEIKSDKKGDYIEIDNIENLPKNAGFYDVRVYYEDIDETCDNKVVKLFGGGSSLYCGCEFSEVTFIEIKGKKVYIKNPKGKIESIEIDGIFNSIDKVVDENFAWDVIKECLEIAYKGIQIPLDRIVDMNPNLVPPQQQKLN